MCSYTRNVILFVTVGLACAVATSAARADETFFFTGNDAAIAAFVLEDEIGSPGGTHMLEDSASLPTQYLDVIDPELLFSGSTAEPVYQSIHASVASLTYFFLEPPSYGGIYYWNGEVSVGNGPAGAYRDFTNPPVGSTDSLIVPLADTDDQYLFGDIISMHYAINPSYHAFADTYYPAQEGTLFGIGGSAAATGYGFNVTVPSGSIYNGSGSYGTGFSGGTPNSTTAAAAFGTTHAGIVSIGGQMQIQTMLVDSTASYSFTGSSSNLAFANTTGSNYISVAGDASHTFAVPVSLSGETSISLDGTSSLAFTGSFAPASGVEVSVGGTGTLNLPNYNGGKLTVTSGRVQLNTSEVSTGSWNKPLVTQVEQLDVLADTSDSAVVDLVDAGKGLVVDYSVGDSSPLGEVDHPGRIANWIKLGFNGGDWLGTDGIVSSAAATNSALAIGYAEAADLFGTSGTFLNVTVDDTAGLLFVTLAGDADLDGDVDTNDYNLWLGGSTGSLTGWINGDFNYDGVINNDDYLLWDANEGDNVSNYMNGPLPALTMVPEPTAFVFAPAIACLLCRRNSRARRHW